MLSFIRGDSILIMQSLSQNNDSETTQLDLFPTEMGKTVWAQTSSSSKQVKHFNFQAEEDTLLQSI